MEFEWDELKNLANAKKHGMCFEEALEAFDDRDQLIVDDPVHSTDAEKRFWLIGRSSMYLILIVFTLRGKSIRLISARLANQKERDAYEQRNTKI